MNKLFSVRTDLRAGALTVYGSDDCKWTRKQLDYLRGKNIPFDYVNCAGGKCPSDVHAFPTLVRDGKTTVGYQEI